jgi:hypothetical protein
MRDVPISVTQGARGRMEWPCWATACSQLAIVEELCVHDSSRDCLCCELFHPIRAKAYLGTAVSAYEVGVSAIHSQKPG